MKKSYYIISSFILLYVGFLVFAQTHLIISSEKINLNSILNLIIAGLYVVGLMGIFLKKKWGPIFVAIGLLSDIPGYLGIYTSSSSLRIELTIINLIFIFLNIIIYRQLEAYNNKTFKRPIKIVLLILGTLYLLYIIFISIPSILNLFAKDIPAVDETGLQITNPNVQDSDNAYFDLSKLTGAVYLPSDDGNIIRNIVTATSGNSWNDGAVNDVLSKNQTTLSLISSASDKSILYDTQFSDLSKVSPNMILSNLNDWRNAGLVASLDALSLLKQGKNVDAMDEAVKVIKVGKLISESNQPLIGYLVGIAIKWYGYNVASKIINQTHFNQTQKQDYLSELNSLKDGGQGLKNAFILEYYVQKNGFAENIQEIIAQENIPSFTNTNSLGSYYYEPNQTIEYFADYAREEIGNVDVSCNSMPNIQNIKLIEPISFMKVYFTENAVGKILHDIISVSLSTVLTKRCEYNARLDKIIQTLSETK